MIFKNKGSFFIYFMVLLLNVVRAQEISSATNPDDLGFLINDMSDEEMLAAVAEGGDPQFLRGRELQSGTCRATNPSPKTVCGMLPVLPGDTSCVNSQATCNGMQYPCTCSGSGETSCSYCTVRMAGAIVCQVTGSSVTFSNTESLMTTCKCTYVGNGQVQQDCFRPSPAPIPLPTFWPVSNAASSPVYRAPSTPAPVYRAPATYTTQSPIYRAPVSYTPFNINYGPTGSSPVANTRPAPTPGPQPRPTVPAPQPGKNNKKM